MGRTSSDMADRLSEAEAAQTAEYVLHTPNPIARPNQQCAWHGKAPVPNAYMSPSDFSLSPMSQRLLRGSRKSKVMCSARAMGLPKDPGFLADPKEQPAEPKDLTVMEDKENGFVPVMLGEKRVGKVKSFGAALNSNASQPLAPVGFSKLKQRQVPKKGLSDKFFMSNGVMLTGGNRLNR